MFKGSCIMVSLAGTILLSASALQAQKGAAQLNALTAAEKKAGWELLFDGKTTSGWHSYNKDFVSKNWTVVDGSIVLDPKVKDERGNGDIVTNNAYENYEFSTEWRITEAGNSGIIFDVKEDPKLRDTYNSGAEMQVLDNVKASDNKKENHLAGLLYDLSGTAELSKPKPVGEWNEAKIIQNKGHLTLYFNGTKTFEGQVGSDEWKNMIANSKFKGWNAFMTTANGKIAFQNHGHEVAFRNIKIRKQ
jgi:hypothetical protein